MPAPVITFLSDYGLMDPFVGLCHAVIARIAPHARVIDLAHGVPRHDVRAGAVVLGDSVQDLPDGVHLAVVDPGVGTPRRGVVVVAGARFLVGPDNGLLWPAAQRLGATQAWELTSAAYRRHPTSATFHGRDIFAPAAAHLCNGVPPAAFGAPVAIDTLVPLPIPDAVAAPGQVHAEVLGVDGFGNVQTSARRGDLEAAGLAQGAVAVHANSRREQALVADTFAAVATGQCALLEDSFGRIAIVVNKGDAGALLGVAAGDAIELLPAD